VRVQLLQRLCSLTRERFPAAVLHVAAVQGDTLTASILLYIYAGPSLTGGMAGLHGSWNAAFEELKVGLTLDSSYVKARPQVVAGALSRASASQRSHRQARLAGRPGD